MTCVHESHDTRADGYQERYRDQCQHQADDDPPEGDDGDRDQEEDSPGRLDGLQRSLGENVHLLLHNLRAGPGRAGGPATSGNGRLHSVTGPVA